MNTYRARLRLRSATLTPWQADTLFGHWCWLILYHEGEPRLQEFLAAFEDGDPPLVLSNGFPMDDSVGWLPRPLLPGPAIRSHNKGRVIEAMERAKAARAVHLVTLDEFNLLCEGEQVTFGERKRISHARPVLKNQINRVTGTTTSLLEEGGGNLYGVDERVFVDRGGIEPQALEIAIYVKAKDDEWASRAETLFGYLAESGYGAKKSAGYGEIERIKWEPFDGFTKAEDANGFVSLSNWVPAVADPRVGFYDILVKYGKLGEGLAAADNPFKLPLIMLTAGSAFYTNGKVAESYGRLVRDIAPGTPSVVQYGFAFTVPACLAGEG